MNETEKLKAIVWELNRTMRCTCDLDKWEPEKDTGHSHVCGIHKEARRRLREKKTTEAPR